MFLLCNFHIIIWREPNLEIIFSRLFVAHDS